MKREIRIDAPTADDAHALMHELPGYRTAVARAEAGWELRIERDRSVDEILREVLGRVDAWLVARGIDDTHVTLENGKTYVVPAPRARAPEAQVTAFC